MQQEAIAWIWIVNVKNIITQSVSLVIILAPFVHAHATPSHAGVILLLWTCVKSFFKVSQAWLLAYW